METSKLSKKFLADEKAEGIEILHSENSYVFDTNGKKYIDFIMGWNVGNLGWGNTEIQKSVRNFKGPDYVYPGFVYKPWAELAELLAEITPGNLKKSFRTTGGTESVETALLIAMNYTGRKKFLSIENSYHGNSIATLSIGSSENKKKFKNLLSGCHKVKVPLDDKALKKIEKRLKQKDIAAFIMEAIICNLGVVIPEKHFMLTLEELCKHYGTLLVIDEIATGFGRTGKMFASEHFDITPDIMCVSKAMSGGYAGIGATITTEKIASAIREDVSIYSTYGWHPASTQAALTNIRYLLKHKTSLFKNTNVINSLFRNRLTEMKFRHTPDINMIGLAIGINVKEKKYAEEIEKKCRQKGLLITSQSKNLMMFPSLKITKEIAHEGLKTLEECL